jgi:hypothetical protein
MEACGDLIQLMLCVHLKKVWNGYRRCKAQDRTNDGNFYEGEPSLVRLYWAQNWHILHDALELSKVHASLPKWLLSHNLLI